MTLAEAQRQYQVALEYARLARNRCDGLVSLENEVEEAEEASRAARVALDCAYYSTA